MSRKIESLLQEAGRALEVFIGLVCALISGTFAAMRKNVNIIVIFSSVIAFNRIEAGVLYTFSETASGVQLTYSGSLKDRWKRTHVSASPARSSNKSCLTH